MFWADETLYYSKMFPEILFVQIRLLYNRVADFLNAFSDSTNHLQLN